MDRTLRTTLAVLTSLLLSGCIGSGTTSGENYATLPITYSESKADAALYAESRQLEELGRRDEANKIILELAERGHTESLIRYATTGVDRSGNLVFKDEVRGGGCKRISLGGWDFKTHWAIQKLAIQGHEGAIHAYFDCQNSKAGFSSEMGASLSLMEWLADQGSLEAIEKLYKYRISYLYNTYTSFPPKNSDFQGWDKLRPQAACGLVCVRSPNIAEAIRMTRLFDSQVENNPRLAINNREYLRQVSGLVNVYLSQQDYGNARVWLDELSRRMGKVHELPEHSGSIRKSEIDVATDYVTRKLKAINSL